MSSSTLRHRRPFAATLSLLACLAPRGVDSKQFSTNAICRQNNCINPVFPGVDDLGKLEAVQWQCQPHSVVHQYTDFCRGSFGHDVALPSPDAGSNKNVSFLSVVKAVDNAAATMFFYHLNGMGLEPWHNKNPQLSDDACVRSVWEMVCMTYFPKAEAGCEAGEATPYVRPCKNVCHKYVKACNVQCCDESVQCVFDHSVTLPDGSLLQTSGYVDEMGPSAKCTGSGASRSAGVSSLLLLVLLLLQLVDSALGAVPKQALSLASSMTLTTGAVRLLLASVLAIITVSLQGCTMVYHSVASWQQKQVYFNDFDFLPPARHASTFSGKIYLRSEPVDGTAEMVGSCDHEGLPQQLVCSGHGVCRSWPVGNESDTSSLLRFCRCETYWADPECRTRRKSQAMAFFLSLFGGFLGLDRFYIGEVFLGFAKLATLGGFGLWWIYDVARVGSAPVYTAEHYRLAADLPHWAFVYLSVIFFAFMGAFGITLFRGEARKQKLKKMMMKNAEEAFHNERGKEAIDADPFGPKPEGERVVLSHGMPYPFGAYGAAAMFPDRHSLQLPNEMRMAPEYAVNHAGMNNALSAHNVYSNYWKEAQKPSTATAFWPYAKMPSWGAPPGLRPLPIGDNPIHEPPSVSGQAIL